MIQKNILFTSMNRTPLMVAASNGNKNLLELLIDRNASLDLQSYTFKYCETPVVECLKEYVEHVNNHTLFDIGST